MEVILLKRDKNLGQIGDIIEVKDGYARNFLFPNNIALRATEVNKKSFESKKHEIEAENLELKSEAAKIAPKIKDLNLIAIRSAGEAGHLYGSVTPKDIAELLESEYKVKVDKSQIILSGTIKNLGVYVFSILLHAEVSVNSYINVARSKEESENQMKLFLNPPKEDKNDTERKSYGKNKSKNNNPEQEDTVDEDFDEELPNN